MSKVVEVPQVGLGLRDQFTILEASFSETLPRRGLGRIGELHQLVAMTQDKNNGENLSQ